MLDVVCFGENGDRQFGFYRKNGVYTMIKPYEVNLGIIDRAKLFHFGSLNMTSKYSRISTLKALKYAKKRKKLVLYDPNLREALWDSLENAKKKMTSVMELVDILKISEEVLLFLTGIKDLT